jgi:hypothetical protein
MKRAALSAGSVVVRALFSGLVALMSLIAFAPGAAAQDNVRWVDRQKQAEEASMNAAQAEERVIEIVNQPVTHIPRTPEAAQFYPGWFHPGAIKPDFDTVDVRATQELPYAKYQYVTSDVTPSEMFYGDELEFNAMTKYFYKDRALPKKRLSESEMLEINRLYRIIGHEDHASTMRMAAAGLLVVGLLVAGWLVLMARRLS